MLKVGLKYCGHCQPQRHMPDLARKLLERLPGIAFVPWEGPASCEHLLILSACPASCAHENFFPQNVLGCDSFNYLPYAREEDLLGAAVNFFAALSAADRA
jgi:hypothetical protein